MKNLKAHKTAAFLALGVVGLFLLGVFNMGLDDKLLTILPFRWVGITLLGYAAFVFNKLLNF